MNRCLLFLILICACYLSSEAQELQSSATKKLPQNKHKIAKNDSIPAQIRDSLFDANGPEMHVWKIDPRFGQRRSVERDSLYKGFHQQSLMDGQDVAVSYLGNVGSPIQSKIFFDRPQTSQFSFLDVYYPYYKKPEDQYFLNTKQAYSNITYQGPAPFIGTTPTSEERFKAEFALNPTKKLNVGFNLDYVYARGYYSKLSDKQLNMNAYTSYLSDKFEMHAFVASNSFTNSENGGLKNDSLLTDPNISSPLDLPVNMHQVWNEMKGVQLYATGKYNLGYTKNDSTFVPVASLIYTTHFANQSRLFASKDSTIVQQNKTALDLLYPDTCYYAHAANDKSTYSSFKNTFAITLNERFRPWVKFGLTGFIEQDFRKYTLPSLGASTIPQYSQSSTVIGGILSKQQGQFLRYTLSANIGVLGYNLGELKLNGDISSIFSIKGKKAILRAKSYIYNSKPTFYENHFSSKYIKWDNDFGDTRRVYLGGEIELPFTKTRLSGGVENIQNYIYYASNKQAAQEKGNIQIISFRLDQNLNLGILHWDNQLVYQATSNKQVLPLPTISIYTNLYLQTMIAHVLYLQLGVDARYTNNYYAPAYDPVLLQFYNQQEKEIGNFPITTFYANMRLKRTRIFAMMYNLIPSYGNEGYFTTPHYPINPTIFKFGISWDFAN